MRGTSHIGFEQEDIADQCVWDDSRRFAIQADQLADGRSFEAEMWGEEGYTFLTYRFPIQGLEQFSKTQIAEYLLSQGIEIDLQKFPAENMQLLSNFENS